MASFLTAAAAAIGSSNIGSAIVRILVAYGVSRLINKATGNTNTTGAVDQGIRLQAAPDTTNPIPLLYGSAYLGGKITDAQLVDSNKTMWYCLTLAEISSSTTVRLSDAAAVATTVDEIYWNNQRVYFKADGITVDYIVNQDGVVDTSPRDLVKIYLYNGAAGPIRPSDLLEYLPSLPTLHGDARTLMPGWVSDERMLNLTFALVRISYNKDKGITGLPNLQFKVSNNLFKPGDALHSFLRNKISGAGLALSQIDTASLVALNGYADDTVSYFDEDDGQTKTLANRYQINGVVNPADNVMNNLQKLVANAGCFVSYDIGTGLWGVTINKDQSAVLAFDDSNIISGIDLTGTNLDSMYNAVEVEFPHRELRDQMDTIRIDLPTEYRNDNEPDNILQLKFDLINEPLQARALGYLELYQNRMDQIVTFTTDYSKINTEAGDVITISTDVYGWTLKPFRVVRVREIESDSGGLAVEITAQEYDSTMYTAGGVPRRPRVPSEPIAIPEISVIGTPAAPTVAELNKVAVPALDITGVTPAGIVDRFEYWYSTDAGTTYKILGSRSNSNGSPYAQGTSLTFRAASLPAGSYLFRVRGGNEKSFGEFSATVAKSWTPVQVTDQVTDKTTIDTPSLGDLLPVLGMGAIAYFAYKAFAPQALAALSQTDLGKLLGIVDPADIVAAQAALEQQAAAFRIINAGNVSFSAGVDDTLTLIAGSGITISAVDIGHEITISATGGGAVNKIIAGSGITVTPAEGTGDVTISVSGSSGGGGGPVDGEGATTGSTSLSGTVFPCQLTISGSTKNVIFTHGNIVFANSSYNGVIKASNVVSTTTILTPSITTTDTNPFHMYYSTCTYNSGVGVEAQTWGAWKRWIPPATVTTQVQTGWTNPPEANLGDLPAYIVDGEYQAGGIVPRNPLSSSYDPFVPNLPVYSTVTSLQNYQLVKAAPGELVAFGVSITNLGDTVQFSTNTIFGKETAIITNADKANTSVRLHQSVTNGAIYVSGDQTGNEVDKLYYSTDQQNWKTVTNVTFQGTSALDTTNRGVFWVMPYVSSIGKFIAYRFWNSSGQINQNSIATSTDGINWTETGTALTYEYTGSLVSIPGANAWKWQTPSQIYVTNNNYYVVPVYSDTHFSKDGVNWRKFAPGTSNNIPTKAIPGVDKWIGLGPSYNIGTPPSSGVGAQTAYKNDLKSFNVTTNTEATYSFTGSASSIADYALSYLRALTRPTTISGQATSSYSTIDVPSNATIIPVSSTSFYVELPAVTRTWHGTQTSSGYPLLRTDTYRIQGYYTVSGDTITATSYTVTSGSQTGLTVPTYTAPFKTDTSTVIYGSTGSIKNLTTAGPVAYATVYYYPGNTNPTIPRTGHYGVGATFSAGTGYYSTSTYKVTYSTS